MSVLQVRCADVTRGRRGPFVLPVVVVLAALLVMALGAGSAFAGHTERVSVNPQGNADSWTGWCPSVSADGRYLVFSSGATNLVAGDTNGSDDVFLRDRRTGETRRLSVASDGTEANGGSSYATISTDGRYVAFLSCATNLVADDTNAWPDVFVHDRETGETQRVSVASDGTQGGGCSSSPSMSADGRYVAFWSCASALVADDTNTYPDVFVHDRETGETELVSVASDGTQGDDCSRDPSMSADGRYMAFLSCATNLVADDTNAWPDVFVHDRETGETQRVSVASDGTQGDACSTAPSLSADGRYVAFDSQAENLVADDTNTTSDVFVHDRETGETERVSVASDGTQADDSVYNPVISADGRYVTFTSCATNLVADDTNTTPDVFVHDRETGETQRVSVATDGTQGDGCSRAPSISAGGRYVVFYSGATNLVAGDTNGSSDVFVHDRETGDTERVSVAEYGTEAAGTSYRAALSADGRYVAFESDAANLVAGDTNALYDAFVYDRQTDAIEWVSVASDGTQADNAGGLASLSADGRYVTFLSCATNLVTDDTNLLPDVFVRDRETGETELVSVATDGTQGDACSSFSSLSADGRYVAFHSRATNLVDGDTAGFDDVFVHDRETGETLRVSVASDGTEGDGDASWLAAIAISADGRYVAFGSYAGNLVADDTNTTSDVFVHDRETGETVRVSVAGDGAQADNASLLPSLSADGRYVTFLSCATNLVTDDTNLQPDVFLHDQETGTTERVSVASDGTQGDDCSWWASISAAGRYVTFLSCATNLVTDDTNLMPDIFLHDQETGTTELVSVASDGTQGDACSWWPSVSADGRYVAFASPATNLVPGDTNGFNDVFVHERLVADFTVDPPGGDAPLTVQFTDLSSARPTAWDWDFGEGGVSTDPDPSHVYTTAGAYTVTLTVFDAAGSDTTTRVAYITTATPPTAAFSAAPTEGIMPLTVDFTDGSTGDIDSWEWDFDDGHTSTQQDPSNEYPDPGVYTVSLTVTGPYSSDTETQQIWVGFLDCGPDNWAFEDSLLCVDVGIVSGYGDGCYHPNWAVTRDQMAAYIARSVCTPMGEAGLAAYTPPATPTFTDVPTDYWTYKHTEYVVEQNIVGGYGDNTYHPTDVLDRAQMAVFIARSIVDPLGEEGLVGYIPPATPTFGDVPNTGYGTDGTEPFWAYTHIEYIAEEGIAGGYGDGLYHPEYVCSRDQMAVYIARAFNLR